MNEIGKMVTGLQHIGLPTNDMAATVRFYQSLGFENGQAVGKHGAIDHICLDVEDVEAAWNAVRDAGYQPLESEIQALPFWDRGVRFFNILGPNGEKLEFGQIL